MKNHKKNNTSIPQIVEIIFNSLYIITVLILGCYLVFVAQNSVQNLWGIMAFVLILGDCFHLVPRILSACQDDKQKFAKSLGIGKLITSVTMTFFYVILWQIGVVLSNKTFPLLTAAVYILALVRIALCLFAQNGWVSSTPSYKWSIYRNLPFALLGGLIACFFAVNVTQVSAVSLMWLAILLSFAFYIPVVLYATKYPKFGMLMLPKTCVYVWMISMGLFIS